VISPRPALRTTVAVGGVGAVGVGARRAAVLDDALRAVGVRPHTEPDPRDVTLLADAAQGQRELLALADQISQQRGDAELNDIRRILGEQLAAVSDDPQSPASPYPTVAPARLPSDDDDALASFAKRAESGAAERASGAVAAGSLAVSKVLASMAAGLDQVAVAARELA
jgi:hypothetical protein